MLIVEKVIHTIIDPEIENSRPIIFMVCIHHKCFSTASIWLVRLSKIKLKKH